VRVLIMDTGRGIGPDKVQMWSAHLGLTAADHIGLVAWWRSSTPLPVNRHLVGGPVLRLDQEPFDAPTQQGRVAHRSEIEATAANTSLVDEAVTGASGGLSTAELDEQLSEQEAGHSQATAADQPGASEGHQSLPVHVRRPDRQEAGRPSDMSHLPILHPRRLRQAVVWRAKRSRRRAERFGARQVRRVKMLRSNADHLPSAMVRTSLRGRKDALSWEFATMAMTSHSVNTLFRTADVVIPVDARAQKAAWLLARRHRGPDVIVTLPAAARAVAARRSSPARERAGLPGP
jgi:hypothetical protein